MIVDVVIEKRFFRCRDGMIWTDNAFPYSFWKRYLSVFSHVCIVARVHEVDVPSKGWHEVIGDKVQVIELPAYIGPLSLLKALPSTFRIMRQRQNVRRCVIYRIPGILSFLYKIIAMRSKQPYAAEVVGDPADTFSRSANTHPLRSIIKPIFVSLLKRQCKGAAAISYVTQFALQQRYPPNKHALSTHYSSICLSNEDFKPPEARGFENQLKLVCIGNLSQPYKGCDIMLNAISRLLQNDIHCSLTWVGGGALLDNMRMLSEKLGIEKHVTFVGNIADRATIRDLLDSADLFVLSSLQEGLPRVVIEAMARGKLCVATNVGGINELLESEQIVEANNSSALAEAIRQITLMNKSAIYQVQQENYQRAQAYHDDHLQEKRESLFHYIHDVSK